MSWVKSCLTLKKDFMTTINLRKNAFNCLLKKMLRWLRLRTITSNSKSWKKTLIALKIKSLPYATLCLSLNSNYRWPSKKTPRSKNFKLIKVTVPNVSRLYTSLSFSKKSCLLWNQIKSIHFWNIELLRKSWKMFSKNLNCLSSSSDMRQITTWKSVFNSRRRCLWRVKGSCKWSCNWLRWNLVKNGKVKKSRIG